MFVYVYVCMCVFGGPQGPVLMSYLCAFLTRARCSAHGTVILGRGWPCSAARLCRLLYLWHLHHLALCFCVYVCMCVSECVHSPVCAFQEGGSAGGLTQEANTVYISIMNQVREREIERGRERRRKREGGREEGMEKAIFPLLFSPLSATNPCGVNSLYSAFAFSPCFPCFPPCPYFIPLLGQIRELHQAFRHGKLDWTVKS